MEGQGIAVDVGCLVCAIEWHKVIPPYPDGCVDGQGVAVDVGCLVCAIAWHKVIPPYPDGPVEGQGIPSGGYEDRYGMIIF